MGFEAGAITGKIGLDEAPAVKALRNVEAQAGKMKQGVEDAMGQAGQTGAKSFLSGLNSELGKRSAAGQFAKLAMGGGAIAGATMIGRELAGVTAEAVKMKDAFNRGEISGGQLFEKIAAGVPVLGQFWEAGRNIRELFSGEEASIAAASNELQRHLGVMKQLSIQTKEFRIESDRAMAAIKKMETDWAREAALSRAPQSMRPFLQAGYSLDDSLAAIKAKQDEAQVKVDAAKETLGTKQGKYGPGLDKKIADLEIMRDAEQSLINSGQLQGSRATFPMGILQIDDQLKVLRDQKEEIFAAAKALQAEEDAQKRVNKEAEEAGKIAKNLARIKREEALGGMGEALLKGAKDWLGGIGKALGLAGHAGKASDLHSNWHLMQLANPRIQAEEVFGPKKVTSADVPQPWVQVGELAQKELAEQVKHTDLLTRIVAALSPKATEAATVDLVTMP